MIPLIETVTGKLVDVVNPDPDTLDIDDIAWSLSRISRFAGHTITAQPYTVAQHCIFVSDLIYENTSNITLALFGLLHDAAEAYIGDIPSPIKHIPELKRIIKPIEDNLLDKICRKYVYKVPTKDDYVIIKMHDKTSQFIEANAFMPSRGKNWPGWSENKISLLEHQKFSPPEPSIIVYQKFLNRFNELRNM